ncbi:MAG: type II toxin-antitoxin system PemK/MazF family toxin [Blastocatellia bacterium]
MINPNRGEVWLVDLGMTAKIRPCLILSIPASDQDRALVTALAHTTSPRGSQFEVAVKTPFLKPGVFDAQNLVTIPHAKLMRKLGVLSTAQLNLIEVAVRFWLGL